MKLLLLMALLPLCLFVNPTAYAQEIDPQEEAEYLQSLYQQYPGISREEVQQKAKDFRLQKISAYWQQVARQTTKVAVKTLHQPALRLASSPSAQTSNVLAARSSNAASAEGLVPDSVEYAALEALYNSLNGSGWTDRTNWLQGSTSSDFDNWSGLTVENGDVTEIFLVNKNLQGTLSPMLGNLTALKKIVIYEGASGYLQDSIPSEIGQLVNLEELSLGGSYRQEGDQGLSGSLPSKLGQLQKLQKLWIGYTAIGGAFLWN